MPRAGAGCFKVAVSAFGEHRPYRKDAVLSSRRRSWPLALW